ncbi:MAG TPA: SET domain-containing protein [Eoetvoesiella sp.]|uniref:SET domain-containing protein n=1 Tax=Eoetvoesiella sp. TaxID=1966355 RepID=UPI002C13A273|nr:SET domain-containing protein [Eoetvoesiella sp.]HWK60195.1 SET domain-containing protein [Eoetvoesiella sp.]
MTSASEPWHSVRQSTLHGNGVFAARDIPAGTRILEYGGRRITPEQADAMHPVNPDDPFHTFFFALSCGKVIDGGNRGTDARWINHSCAPNCETQENSAGTRVYIMALRDITAGEELFYDYGLVMEGKITKKLQKQYQCLCGSSECRHTMLALPEKKAKKKKSKKAADGRSEGKRKAKDGKDKPQKDKGGKKDRPEKVGKKKATG